MNMRISIAMCLILIYGLINAPVLANGVAPDLSEQAKPIYALLDNRGQILSGYTVNKDELRRLYEQRGYEPAWKAQIKSDRAPLTAFLDSLVAYTTYHGLSAKDYPVDQLRTLLASEQETVAPELELLMTSWLLQLAHDMQGDRINLALIYPGWSLARAKKDVPIELGKAIAENRVQAFFDDLAPKNLTYMRLADALKAYRDSEKAISVWPTIPSGPTIKPGQRDSRIKNIRARLAAEHYTLPALPVNEADSDLYGDDLKEVVIAYQARNGLEADGNIGALTIKTMNVSLSKRIGQILANMERLRHMPDSFPARHARVNSADASIKVVDGADTLYHAVVVVGRPDRKTPFINSAIRSVIFNPAWNVPAKIAREDILPKLRKDPHYLEKMGMVIKSDDVADPHGTGIDWNAIEKSEFNFRLRQSPGDLNSLGQIKFDFDNDFAVYLHDTSHPELFVKAERHLSSGCVRIKDPEVFAQVVLAKNEGSWTLDSIHQEIDKRKTRWLKVAEPLPLFILYDTVFFPTNESLIHFRNDVYNYDQFLLTQMNEEKVRK